MIRERALKVALAALLAVQPGLAAAQTRGALAPTAPSVNLSLPSFEAPTLDLSVGLPQMGPALDLDLNLGVESGLPETTALAAGSERFAEVEQGLQERPLAERSGAETHSTGHQLEAVLTGAPASAPAPVVEASGPERAPLYLRALARVVLGPAPEQKPRRESVMQRYFARHYAAHVASEDSGERIAGDRVGVPVEHAAAVAELGSQGAEGSCARYGLTACAVANGVDTKLEDVKLASKNVILGAADAKLRAMREEREALRAKGRKGRDWKERNRFAFLKAEIKRAERLRFILSIAPNYRGLTPDEIQATARAVGLEVEDLPSSLHPAFEAHRLDTEARMLVGASLRERRLIELEDKDFLAFEQAAGRLRFEIVEALAAGEAVMASIDTGPGRHAVAVLAHGRTAAGKEVFEIFDSQRGKLQNVPAEHFMPVMARRVRAAGPVEPAAEDDAPAAAPGSRLSRFVKVSAILGFLTSIPVWVAASPLKNMADAVLPAIQSGDSLHMITSLFTHNAFFIDPWLMLPLAALIGVAGIPLRVYVEKLAPAQMNGAPGTMKKLAATHPVPAVPKFMFGAAVEEFGFRGMLIPVGALFLVPHLGPTWAFLAASFGIAYIFAVVHRYGSVWTRVVGSLIYTAQFATTGSLLFPTLTHFFFNYSVYLWSRYHPKSPYKPER